MDGFLQTPPRLPDAWASDRALRETVAFHLGPALFETATVELASMGSIATDPATLALVAQAEAEPPRHIPYSAWGERIDEIVVSPAYAELGRIGVERGVTALPYEKTPYGASARVVWAALISMWGASSALYSCPVAMTDAAARTLLQHGDVDDVMVVQRLTTRDPASAWTSGQWMTETTGGSDVSRTETLARRDGDAMWRLFGTKWFTSATTSEMALTLARPEGGKRLALFRVHRVLEDGRRNAMVVRRLKDKLGTRALPTAELELRGALAAPVGDPLAGDGVRKIATMLNLTRIHNALGAAGGLGRGLALARAYADVRHVFGRPLRDHPAHRSTLADLAVDYAASLVLAFDCCRLMGRVEAGVASDDERALLRGLTPVAKLTTARWAVAGAAEVMEAIGGVGYCEDSGVPAMVRNAHVLPIWEGTTNVLSLDLLRAEQRQGSLHAILADAERRFAELVAHPSVGDCAGLGLAAVEDLRRRAASDDVEAGARSLALGVGRTYATASLAEQGAWALTRGDGRTAAAANRLARRGLVPQGPPEDPELAMDDEVVTA